MVVVSIIMYRVCVSACYTSTMMYVEEKERLFFTSHIVFSDGGCIHYYVPSVCLCLLCKYYDAESVFVSVKVIIAVIQAD